MSYLLQGSRTKPKLMSPYLDLKNRPKAAHPDLGGSCVGGQPSGHFSPAQPRGLFSPAFLGPQTWGVRKNATGCRSRDPPTPTGLGHEDSLPPRTGSPVLAVSASPPLPGRPSWKSSTSRKKGAVFSPAASLRKRSPSFPEPPAPSSLVGHAPKPGLGKGVGWHDQAR